MTDAFICDAARTPIGRFGGALAAIRPDDLGAIPIAALKARNPGLNWEAVEDVIYGCANQAGEDNRNVARMSSLLAGLPILTVDEIIERIDAVTRDDLAYFRAHGRNAEGYMKGKTVAERFAWDYSDEELRELAGRAEGLASDADVVHVMFNNNRGADAPKAVERMRELLGQVAAT